jgi:DNA-binding LacI/PurR family transcriptional regulator
MAASESGNGRGVTLEEVARAAGVSRATVSRVVNGNARVGARVKRDVEREIDRLGYVPNPAARMLVTRRSDSVGVVIPEPTTHLFGDPYFPRLLRGISAELGSRGLQLVLLMPQSRAESDRVEGYLAAGHVDGVMLVSLHGDDPLPARLHERGVPLVVGGRPPGKADVSYVDVDNAGGARVAVEHLIGAGRRTIATINGALDMAAGLDRRAGYRRALSEAGLTFDPDLEADGAFDQEEAATAMRGLLALRPDIDAVFVASDLMAAGALTEVVRAGRRVPEDVAIVGYDDSPLATTLRPPLSSVRQPIEEMGREMTRLLVDVMGAKRPVAKRVVLGTELVVRESSGREARS